MAKNEFVCDCNIIHKDIVEKTMKNMQDEELLLKLAEFFKILGDSTRVKILYALDILQLTTYIIDGKHRSELMLIPKTTTEERTATIITVVNNKAVFLMNNLRERT